MKKTLFGLMFVVSLFFISCGNPFNFNHDESGSISVKLPGAYSARTIVDEPEDPNSILYTVKLTGIESDFSAEKEGKTGELISFTELNPGKYKVSIKYESNLFLLAGETEVTVIAGQDVEAKVTLKDTAVFSDEHVTVEQSPEYGFKFTIKRLPEDKDKRWGSVQLFNYTYNIGIENVEKVDDIDEVVYYWPFAEKGKKYVFTVGNSRSGQWYSSQVSVVSEVTTNYKLNLDKLNNFYDNCKATVTEDNKKYNLKLSGCTLEDVCAIYPFEISSGYINLSVWGADSEDSIGDYWTAGGDYYYEDENPFNTDIEINELMNNAINSYNWPLNNYKYKRLWASPCLYTESFPDQVFEFNAIVSDNFELNLPEKASAKHFKAEKVENGIKITILKDPDYQYAYGHGNIRVIDWKNNYSYNITTEQEVSELNEILEKDGEYSFIWPFANKDEYLPLEFQYILEKNDGNYPCICEYIGGVLSGQGSNYTPGEWYDNGNLFTITNDDSEVNSKRIITINQKYETITQRIPKTVKEGSLTAELSFCGSESSDPFNWDNREWICNITGSFNKIGELTEPEEGNGNYYISQIFGDGLDIASIKPYCWRSGPELFARIGEKPYIVPELSIFFKLTDNDAIGRFAIYNQTGALKYTPLKQDYVYVEQCDYGIKFTVAKSSKFNNGIGIGEEQTGIKISSKREEGLEIGESFEIIDSLVEKNKTYTFHLEGFDENGKYGYGNQIEFYYTGETKGTIDKDLLENNYKKLHAKIDYFDEKDESGNEVGSSIGLKIDGDGSKLVNNKEFIDFPELSYKITVEGDFYSSEYKWLAGISIQNINDISSLFSEYGLNLAEFSAKNSFGWLKGEDWITGDYINFLAENDKTYLDLFTSVTIDNESTKNGPCAGMVYRLPGLTNLWVDDEDCFIFDGYPCNLDEDYFNEDGNLYWDEDNNEIVYSNYQLTEKINDEGKIDALILPDKDLFYILYFEYKEEDGDGNINKLYELVYGVPSEVLSGDGE